MGKPINYTTRDFLNLPGHNAGAYVFATLNAGCRSADGRTNAWVSATLSIADCNRVAELEFGAYGAASRENSLFKARLLRDRVNAFVDTLELAHMVFDVVERPEPLHVATPEPTCTLILPDPVLRVTQAASASG